jgi:hypothetical protein
VISAPEPPRPSISIFCTGAAAFYFKYLLIYAHEAECTPFQTHRYSENLVAPGIETGTSGSAARNSTDRPQRQSIFIDETGTANLVQYGSEDIAVNTSALFISSVEMWCGSFVQWIGSMSENFRKRHIHMFNILFILTDTMTSQNVNLSSWDSLYCER